MKNISTYSHYGQIGAMVEMYAEVDGFNGGFEFLEEFVELGQVIAMHVVAYNPANVADLLAQGFIENSDLSVRQVLIEKSESSNNAISISRFVRWDTGTSGFDNDPRHDPAMAMQLKRA